MTQTVREVSRSERLVTLELTDADINGAKAAAARRLSKDLRIPGFRPGKAPRPVVEAAIGPERLRTEAIEDLIPLRLGTVLEEADLTPAVSPSLERVDEVEGGVNVEVKVTLWPTLEELPSYQGREIVVVSPELSDDELEATITRLREQFASLETVDRPAEVGDFVSIDIRAERDGVPVEDASASELLYEIGSDLLIDGIDDRLVGKAADDSLSFAAPLPAGFGDQVGLEAVFTVKVNEVKAKVLPELNDEWVDESTEFESVSELRSALAEIVGNAKRRTVWSGFRQQAVDLLVDEANLDLPERLLQVEMETIFHRFAHRLEGEEIDYEDYLSIMGLSAEEFAADLRRQAERSLGTRIVLEAVARREELQIAPEEVATAIELMARSADRPEEVRQAFQDQVKLLSLASDILRTKAMEVVVAAAKAVDEAGNPVDLTLSESTVDGTSGEFEAKPVAGQPVADQPGGFQLGSAQIVEAEVEAEVVEAEVVDEEA